MPDYEKLYKILFNVLTDAIECAENGDFVRAKEILIGAQQAAEDVYIEAEEEGAPNIPVYILPHDTLE
jgi:hypothetical protein